MKKPSKRKPARDKRMASTKDSGKVKIAAASGAEYSEGKFGRGKVTDRGIKK